MADVPLETEALTLWLYKRYQEKEEMMKTYNSIGQFPFSPGQAESSNYITQPRTINRTSSLVMASHILLISFLLFEVYILWHIILTFLSFVVI